MFFEISSLKKRPWKTELAMNRELKSKSGLRVFFSLMGLSSRRAKFFFK